MSADISSSISSPEYLPDVIADADSSACLNNLCGGAQVGQLIDLSSYSVIPVDSDSSYPNLLYPFQKGCSTS